MTTPTGTIKSSDIRSEFGATSGDQNTGPVSLGAYRIKQSVSELVDLPLDTGVPQSVAVGNSAIGFGNLRGKKLNVVVDCTPAPNTVATKVNARSLYNANTSVTVIGGFKSRPDTVKDQKVWIHTNGPIGASSPASSRTFCTLFTGEWDATTDLRVDIGPKGSVMGAGGAGGNSSNGNAGRDGSSAIGIIATNSVVVTNRGTVLAGGGGGGRGGQGGDGQFLDGKTTLGDSVGGPGGSGGVGQGYNQTNTAGAAGGPSPGPGRVIGNVFVTGSGNGGNGGTGGTWGNVGAGGSTGRPGSRTRPNPGVTAGRPGFNGGSGGYVYVVSNDGRGVSGLPSVNVALNTIPT
jgi:hypothetical protein